MKDDFTPMTFPMETLTTFSNSYAGHGFWIDSAGESKRYEVLQQIQHDPARLLVSYNHAFVEEGNSTHGEFVFEFVSPTIFNTSLNGVVVGNGYLFDSYLHFNIRIGDVFVETSYARAANSLQVRGSSTSNSGGRFIAWSESLTAIS